MAIAWPWRQQITRPRFLGGKRGLAFEDTLLVAASAGACYPVATDPPEPDNFRPFDLNPSSVSQSRSA